MANISESMNKLHESKSEMTVLYNVDHFEPLHSRLFFFLALLILPRIPFHFASPRPKRHSVPLNSWQDGKL